VKILNKHFLTKYLVFTFLIILKPLHAAQDNIRFQRIALEQGLSQETILSAYQDQEGFMWFGTQEGLNRYDGYQFKVFTHSLRHPDSLSSDWVYSIEESQDGNLWIGTINGINIFDKSTQTFRHLKHDPNNKNSLSENNSRVIYKDSDKQLWVGTDSGLNRFNPETREFSRFYNQKEDTLEPNEISSIAQDKEGFLWIGTDGNGLSKFDPKTEKIVTTSKHIRDKSGFSNVNIKSLYIDNLQRIWIGTAGDGLTILDIQDNELHVDTSTSWKPQEFDGLSISHIYQDKIGNVWIATDLGLFRFNSKLNTFQSILNEPDNLYSLSTNRISYLYQDSGGVFWVGTYSGLNKWNTATAKFDHVRVTSNFSSSLSDNFILGFYEAGNEKMWIATSVGLNLLNTENGLVTQFHHDSENMNSLRSNKIASLFASDHNELWIGYRGKGLSKLDRKTGQYTHYKNDPNDITSLASNGVSSIKQARNGKLWIGAFGGGLNLFDPETEQFIRYTHNKNDLSSIGSNKILSILEDEDGLLWLATLDSGISIFNPRTSSATRLMHEPNVPSSLGNNFIWAIFEDSKSNIWVGTSGSGLNKLSAKNRYSGNYKFEKISREEGLPSNTVYGIIEDSEGFLWLSTNRGLTKFNPNTKAILNYDSSHGLQGNEFNTGAYYQAGDGKVYFGGTNGVTAFYPEDISPNSHVPPVVLTKFQKLNEVVSIDSLTPESNNIQISHKDYLIAFEFAGLDYASPSNNRYKYKLEGFDEEWIEAADVRKATYTNLPSGNYVFRVKASNNDGIWNDKGAVVALTVLPAPWYSWWAYLIYGLISLAILYRIYRSYVNKLLEEANYRKKLESEVESRTVELSSANEQLLNASITDQLTGLNNRRYLNSIVEQRCSAVLREFEREAKTGKSNSESGPRLFFLMFDLDGFKPINDAYGHGSGDKVIVQVGEVLKSVCRKSDTVIRWGGDEFLVMGRVEESTEVEILAERLRSKIAANGFDIDLKQKMYLSCSIGYSLFPFSHHYPNALSWEQVHLLADKALYKSKDAGRNKWTGILQSVQKPPANVMGTLTQNIEKVIKDGHVTIKQNT
jgi:diguanylate cyclase (GGDEF)-like protein